MRIFATSVVVLVLVVLTARETSAQTTQGQQPQDPNAPVRVLTQRPYRGVFGGGVGETSQLLTLGLNMGGGYDSSVFVDNRQDPNAIAPVSRRRSGFLQGSANLNYSLSLGAVSFSAGAGVSASHYPSLDVPVARRYLANAGGTWRVSTRASLGGRYSIAYLPLQHLASLPGGLDPALGPIDPFDSTIGAASETYRTESGGVNFNYRISQRIGSSFDYSHWRIVSPDGDRDVSTNGASARVTYALTQSIGVYGGYHVDSGQYGSTDNQPRYYTHSGDFGLDFAKALSLTRKTTAGFGTGLTGVTDGNQTRYALTGFASLRREIARSWGAGLTYNRNVGFAQAFRQPVFSDSLSANVGGLISRRLRFNSGLSMSFGRVGFSDPNDPNVNTDRGYRALYASAGLGVAISRMLSGGVRYSYSRYRFGGDVNVPTDLLFQAGRHGVNVYLSSWIPLMSRTRRP
ncbi:MAG TPA: hypothetical protein VES67_17890 [Vicinamibacterales bacterium]|nr:hypothetical protein [Vicinamibacterales bacterium]